MKILTVASPFDFYEQYFSAIYFCKYLFSLQRYVEIGIIIVERGRDEMQLIL